MTIEDRIIEILKGYSKPVKRRDLLNQLRDCGEDTTDRLMRKSYAKNPLIISNSTGIYLAKTKEEVESFYKQERRRGLSILVRARKARRFYIENHKAKEVPINYSYEKDGQGYFVK